MIILEDADSVLWLVSATSAGTISTVVVSSGTPSTIYLNDRSADSWQLGISTSGDLQLTSVASGDYPLSVAITSSVFLAVGSSGSVITWALYYPSIVVDSVIDALGAFIQPFVGDAQIIRAQVNRVAPPVGSFVELTEILQCDLEYPRNWYDRTYQQRKIIGPKRIVVQADFYGSESGDWCSAIKGVFRTAYAAAQFPAGIAPLYTDDGHEAPLLTGEQQYERRWALSCSLQFNPMIIVPQQSADVLKMNIVEAVDL